MARVESNSIAVETDYNQVMNLLQKKDPQLMQRIYALPHCLSDMELKTVLLLRIGLTQKEVATLTARERSAVPNTLNRLFEKIHHRKPINSAESQEWVAEI